MSWIINAFIPSSRIRNIILTVLYQSFGMHLLLCVFAHISYSIQGEKKCPKLAFGQKNSIGCFFAVYLCEHIDTQMYTWWSLMCTQLLYWRTNATQHKLTWHRMREREEARCNRDQARTEKMYMSYDGEHRLISSHLYILQWFVICYHILLSFSSSSFSSFFPVYLCDKCTLLFCVYNALLKQMIPMGIILQTSVCKKSRLGLFIFPFLDVCRSSAWY